MHYANSIAGALYKSKFKSSETPTRKGTVSVNCSVYTASQMMTETEKFSDLGEISVVTMRLGIRQLPIDCSMRIFCHNSGTLLPAVLKLVKI